jgi:hypothetical protein
MNLDELTEPLTIDQIDFRIQSINKGGYATILAYKDARVDINRLNSVCGKLGWKREHTRENHNCIVSIWDSGNKHWVSKEDTGTESNTEQEKGLASDSFKRACFNWGIGIELYDYPLIQIKLNDDEWEMRKGRDNKERPSQTWKLKLKEWKWHSKFDEGQMVYLACKDDKGQMRFEWGNRKAENAKDRHDKALNANMTSIAAIKDFIASESYSEAYEAWDELEREDQEAIMLATSKGGCFTTEERKTINNLYNLATKEHI